MIGLSPQSYLCGTCGAARLLLVSSEWVSECIIAIKGKAATHSSDPSNSTAVGSLCILFEPQQWSFFFFFYHVMFWIMTQNCSLRPPTKALEFTSELHPSPWFRVRGYNGSWAGDNFWLALTVVNGCRMCWLLSLHLHSVFTFRTGNKCRWEEYRASLLVELDCSGSKALQPHSPGD